MGEQRGLLYIIVGSVSVVFVGSFIATVFIPGYSGAAVFAPVMTGVAGAVVGITLAGQGSAKRNGNGRNGANGKNGEAAS